MHSNWLLPLVENFFELNFLSDNRYSKVDCYYTNRCDDEVAIEWSNQGRKVVLDCLWEPAVLVEPQFDCYILQNQNWLWYQESLWYRYLEYHNYVPNRLWNFHALMPIRKQRNFRDFVVKFLGNNLDRFLWSYQDQGRHLPNSGDSADWNTQRLFRPEWYDSCSMSLVLESSVENNGFNRPLISEKTFKPIAFWHPFVVCGDRHSLKYLRQLGFETFDNLFNETYDSIDAWPQRLRTAAEQCLQFRPQHNSYDTLTMQKLAHNHAHFFDQTLIEQKIKQEILEPLLHYAET